MVGRLASWFGIAVLLCATPDPSLASLERVNDPGVSHGHARRHHVKRGQLSASGERVPLAQSDAAAERSDPSSGEAAADRGAITDLVLRSEAQSRQAGLLGKRLDGLEDRLAGDARERWQDAASLQRRLSEQESRLDAQDARWAEWNASRSDLGWLVPTGGALLAMLLAAGALIVGARQRYAAMAEAEGQADRLFRTYRLEFDMLAQAAHELEARLQAEAVREPSAAAPVPERMIG